MFDLGYFDSVKAYPQGVQVYADFYVWALIVLAYAAWWDVKQRRVPNWVWLYASIPIPAMMLMRDLTLDLFFLVPTLIICLGLRLKLSWGMGDAKAIMFLYLLLGSFPAITITLLAIALTGTTNKKDNIPFLMPLFVAAMLGIGLVMVWMK